MIERLEGTFWGYQDCELYYQVWQPQTSVGTILVTHGIAEHSDCYQQFAEDLGEKGWSVFVWDLRGHGRSEGKRGYVNHFHDLSDDLDAAIKFLKAQEYSKNKPLVLFGHSLGGLITLKSYINHAPSGISSLALSSPSLGLTMSIPKFKEKAAHFLAEWLPKVTLYNEINFYDLVHDENKVREYKTDPLRHDKISPRLYLGIIDAIKEISPKASEIHIPVIMQIAGQEKLVSNSSAEKFFEKLGSQKKELFIYTDSYHEVFNDIDRDKAITDLLGFI